MYIYIYIHVYTIVNIIYLNKLKSPSSAPLRRAFCCRSVASSFLLGDGKEDGRAGERGRGARRVSSPQQLSESLALRNPIGPAQPHRAAIRPIRPFTNTL